MTLIPTGTTEVEVAKMAIDQYLKALEVQERNESIMALKPLPYGTLVVKKGTSHIDVVMRNFNSDNSPRIGIIVGAYDLEPDAYVSDNFKREDMYRVHYDENSRFIGEHIDNLEKYYGPVPEHLKDVKWNEIYSLGFNK